MYKSGSFMPGFLILEAKIEHFMAKVPMQNPKTAIYVIENIFVACYRSYSSAYP
jgi:hypothetical protein